MKELINRNNLFLDDSNFKVDKNVFDLSFVHPRDMQVGKLYPVGVIPTMPGDRMKCSVNLKGYMETLLKNGFYNFRINLRAYYCRTTQLDPRADGIFSGGPDGNYDEIFSRVYLHDFKHFKRPYESLQDVFGLPLSVPFNTLYVNANPYIMYDLIYHSYYIDSIIEDNIPYYITNKITKKDKQIPGLVDNDRLFFRTDNKYERMFDSANSFRSYLSTHGYPEVLDDTKYSINDIYSFMYNVNYIKDRYTSSHIAVQLGTPPTLPIDLSTAFDFSNLDVQPSLSLGAVGSISSKGTNKILGTQRTGSISFEGATINDYGAQSINVFPYGYGEQWNNYFKNALQTSVSSFSVTDLRLAFQTQIIQEGMMLGGWEHYQYLKYFFGVDLENSSQSRPRYLGGTRKNFITSDVFSTAATSDAPLGSYAGRGHIDDSDFLFDSFFEDFGYVMIVAYVDTNACYYNSQGVKKHWVDNERFNYPNPAFYHLSMQGVETSELYVSSATTTLKGDVFGFNGIYDEWRMNTDYVTGNLRDTLSFWTSARIFDDKPVLNPEFLKVKQSDYDRIFSVESDLMQPFIMAFGFNILAYRNLPERAVPGFIDHR